MSSPEPFYARIEPPHGLKEAVLARITRAARRAARVRLAAFGVVVLVSGTALAFALGYAVQEFYASGFYDYMALVATDRALAMTYSRDLLYSLLESVPSLAILILLACVTLLAWSVRRAGQSARVAFITSPAHG